jgi:hypothetical protein
VKTALARNGIRGSGELVDAPQVAKRVFLIVASDGAEARELGVELRELASASRSRALSASSIFTTMTGEHSSGRRGTVKATAITYSAGRFRQRVGLILLNFLRPPDRQKPTKTRSTWLP